MAKCNILQFAFIKEMSTCQRNKISNVVDPMTSPQAKNLSFPRTREGSVPPVSTKCEDEKEEGRKRNMTRSISEVTAEKRRGRLDRSATQRHETFFPFQNRVSPEMHNKLDKLSMEKKSVFICVTVSLDLCIRNKRLES